MEASNSKMCTDSKSKHSISGEVGDPSYQPLKEQKESASDAFSWKSALAQGLVAGAVMLSSAACGMPVGYSAILLPQLKYVNETMRIDEDMGSWIASVHSAATPIGSLLSGFLMDQCGRKLALQIAALPLIVGWLFIGLANSHTLLLVGRLIAGLSAGLAAAAGQVLIGEISEPRLRGLLSSGPFASYSLGILIVYALGSVLNWRLVAAISTILPILSIGSFFFLPESPVWLVRNGKFEEAEKGLVWLRGGNINQAKREACHLLSRAEEDSTPAPSPRRLLLRPEVYKPLLILNVFNLLQVLSGTYIIVFYAVDILAELGPHAGPAAVLTGLVRFLCTLLAALLLLLLRRRSLALASGVGAGGAALLLAAALRPGCAPAAGLAAACLLAYVASNTLGLLVLPGVLLAELLPARVRGPAGGLTFMAFNVALFGASKVFPAAQRAVGVRGVFCWFGVVSLLASGWLYVVMPETKGKTLSQIEDYFKAGNVTWIGRSKKAKEELA